MTFFARLTGDRDAGTYFVESRRPLFQVLNGQQLVLGVGKARDPFIFLFPITNTLRCMFCCAEPLS